MLKLFIPLSLCLALLSSCSTIKPYQPSGNHHLNIYNNSDEGIKTEIDVYHVNQACQLDYQGTITAKDTTQTTRIKTNQINYLVVRFSSSTFFSGSHSMSKVLIFKPESDHTYYLDLSYIDDIYNIKLDQSKHSAKQRKTVSQLTLNKCQ